MTEPTTADEWVARSIEHAIGLYQEALLFAARGLSIESQWRQELAENELRRELRVLRSRG